MKLVRSDLRSLLLASTDVVEIIGSKVYPCFAPQNTAMPYVTYQMTSVERMGTHDQDVANHKKADRFEFLVSAWAEDIDEASDLAEAIDEALDGRNSSNTFVFLLNDATDIADLKGDNSGTIIYQIAMSFTARRLPT